VQLVEVGGWAASINGIIDGDIDASITSSSSTFMKKMEASPRGVYHPPLPHSDSEGWARVQKVVPWYVQGMCTHGPGVPGGSQESIASIYPILIGTTAVSDEIAYSLTKAMVTHFDDYKDGAPAADGWALDRQLYNFYLPMHPGSIAFYKEAGTWNAEGHAYFYDVTDPRNMELVDTVQVDARTVNDVKVSEDGTLCVISREGASNRRNGFVMIDCTDPRDAEILSSFDQGLTGGVHNVFLDNNHVYAVNNGRRWDVVNVEDPRNPFRVSRFETDTPGRSVHDVWIRDGIAYQAGRSDGLIMVDVGGGGLGGSPNTPVEMGRFPQITGWNHAVWPFRSPSTGKLYVIGGDEAFHPSPRQPDGGGILWEEGIPSRAKGWLHFVDFTDPENPEEVARFELADSGPHNLWVDWEEEIMYVGYFDAGLRVVDVSGDLLGDLYRQGRQIARFFPEDNEGFLANAAFTWGPQPHKGTIFLADFNSGLWAVRLKDSAPDAGGN